MSTQNSRFLQVRKALHLSQDAFAKALRLSRSHVSNIENGKRELNEQTRYLLCVEFGVSESWLSGGGGPMFQPRARDAGTLADKPGGTGRQEGSAPGVTGSEAGQAGAAGTLADMPGGAGSEAVQAGAAGAVVDMPGGAGRQEGSAPGGTGSEAVQAGAAGTLADMPGGAGSKAVQTGAAGTLADMPGGAGSEAKQAGAAGAVVDMPGGTGSEAVQTADAEVIGETITGGARGQAPAERAGRQRAEALRSAAMLFHGFQSVAYAGRIEELLRLLGTPPFSEQVAYMLALHRDAALDGDSARLALRLFDRLFESTFGLSDATRLAKRRGAARQRAFAADPLTRYLETLYREMGCDAGGEDGAAPPGRVSGLAAAGAPIFSQADGETVPVPSKYLDTSRYFIVRAKGDSMSPALPDGSYVVVEHSAEPVQGGLALVGLEGPGAEREYAIKLVYFQPDAVELRSYNPDYPPMVYPRAAVRSAERIVHTIVNG